MLFVWPMNMGTILLPFDLLGESSDGQTRADETEVWRQAYVRRDESGYFHHDQVDVGKLQF